jgi:hypothetical protein
MKKLRCTSVSSDRDSDSTKRTEVLSIDALACTVWREVWLSWRVPTEQLSLLERVVVR